jgi:hypothetical protein
VIQSPPTEWFSHPLIFYYFKYIYDILLFVLLMECISYLWPQDFSRKIPAINWRRSVATDVPRIIKEVPTQLTINGLPVVSKNLGSRVVGDFN